MSDVTNETPEEAAFFESEGAKEVPAEAIPDDAPQEQAKEKEAPKAEEKKDAEVPKVPIHALHEARMEIKELREKNAKMEGRFEEFVKRVTTPQEQPKSVEEDPIGVIRALQSELAELKQSRTEEQENSQRMTEQQQAVQSVMRKYSAMASEYQAKTPDFKDAYNHWMTGLKDELVDLGYTDWQQQIEQMELNIVAKALQDGANPAERIYAAAKRRGFKKEDPAKEDPAKRFEQLQKGQSAAKSLSTPSGDQEPPLTLQALAEMDDDDFDKNWDKVMKANRR